MSKSQSKKKESLSSRVSLSEAAASCESLGSGSRFPIWPEWSDVEISKEKWDSSNKSHNAPYFEDPEGKLSLPALLNVHSWKRPTDFIINKAPLVVEDHSTFDLIASSEHLLCSELMRWIIAEIYIVWNVCNCTPSGEDGWRPWEHIYSLCKPMNGHLPLYNSYGKYVIRLYWMGCWRKITVDDSMPFSEANQLLLPASACQSELWPMLLAKALLKVANTNIGPESCGKMGELNFIHMLTGWIPEVRTITSLHVKETWDFLRGSVPEFQHPDERLSEMKPPAAAPAAEREPGFNKSPLPGPERSKGSAEIVVCASYYPLHPYGSSRGIGRMNVSSEVLRQYGLSLLHSHIVLLTRTRACPLEQPVQPPPVPRWKLIRMPKKTVITDEPQEPPLSKAEQFIEVASPFLSCVKINAGQDMELLKTKTWCPKKCISTHDFPDLEGQQSAQQRPSYGSPLVSISEREETDCEEAAEPDGAGWTTNTPNSAADNMEVTAEVDQKDVDSISSDQPQNPNTNFEREESSAPVKCALQEVWVDLDDFAKCFHSLLVFHKAQTYPHQTQASQFKSSVLSKAAIDTISPGSSTHSLTTGSSFKSAVASPDCPEVRGTHYLCVDSVESSQLLISFSALLLWGDTPGDKTEISHAARGSAVLIALPYTWKSLQLQLPLLTIKTTCSKAAMLDLPPGRHVLYFCAKAAVGYHLHLCSMTPFIFGDEETIMSNLTKESALFMDQASSILRTLSRVVSSFSDEQQQLAARRMLQKTHRPQHISTSLRKHDSVFSRAVYHMIHGALGRKLTAEERFAVCSLTADPSLLYTDPKEHSPTLNETAPPESWRDRQPTDTEVKAVTTLQAAVKGCLVRGIVCACKPGTEKNLSASKILSDMWPKVESDVVKHAARLLWSIIDHSEKKAEWYRCLQDEWSRITFADYSVPVPTTATSWILLFREVFLVEEEMLLAPKIFSPIPHYLLHVINNDTGEELDMLFNKAAPHIYQPNERGYTFVAEAAIPDSLPVSAKWRMRLIGEKELLPKLSHEPPLSTFSVREFQDYYIPDKKSIICRYSVQVRADVLATVQFQTSKPDVTIRLTVLDQEREETSKMGKGRVTIPAFFFLANNSEHLYNNQNFSAEKKQEASSTQEEGVKVSDASKQRPWDDGTAGASESSSERPQPPTEPLDHKYVVSAEVLHKSWPMDGSELTFVQNLSESRRNETRVNENPFSSPADTVKHDGKAPASSKAKSRKGKSGVLSKTNSKAAMQELDVTKPHWTLRVVVDQSRTESIDVMKDLERLDQITAVKKAWEMAEPGRYAKALQSRLKFLNQVQRPTTDESPSDVDQKTDPASSRSQSSPSHSLSNQNLINLSSSCPRLDYTPFIRRQKDSPVLDESNMEELRQKECLQKIQTYRLVRENMLEQQKQQRLNRKELMTHQLDNYEKMQAAMWQEGLRLCEALKDFSCGQTVATEEETAAEAPGEVQHGGEEEPPTPAPPRQPKKNSKKR
ncbi:androglobin isoform X5 [Takifugu flavidus]|uniref:androglobin isoform X5 n=1 Tax=Takifugu flavidus TaxID=433684 RepID=UPI0025449F92|nr:androglobin isoform X5 [Takifugu flavidus]